MMVDLTLNQGLLDFLEKVSLVALGWFLGWGNEFLREWRNRRKIKAQLIEELEAVTDRILTVQQSYERALQYYVHKFFNATVAIEIPHPIYTNYYKEVYSHLTRAQRSSYDHIHGRIDSFNEMRARELKQIDDFYEARSPEAFEALGRLIRAQFLNVSSIRWHIQHHLEHPDNPPELKYGSEAHKAYLEDQRGFQRKMDEIIRDAKTQDIKGEILKSGAWIEFI